MIANRKELFGAEAGERKETIVKAEGKGEVGGEERKRVEQEKEEREKKEDEKEEEVERISEYWTAYINISYILNDKGVVHTERYIYR